MDLVRYEQFETTCAFISSGNEDTSAASLDMSTPGLLLLIAFIYSTVLCSLADSLCSQVILHEGLAFYSAFLSIHRSGVLTALTWPVPHEAAAVLVRSVYTIVYIALSLLMYEECKKQPTPF